MTASFVTSGRFHEPATIVGHPDFIPILAEIGARLVANYETAPRIVRYAASLQRWLITHSIVALHYERDPSDPASGLTTTRLIEIVRRHGAASRNTASAHLAELMAGKMVREIPDHGLKRSKPLEVVQEVEIAMSAWFSSHIGCLDRLDGGNRMERFLANPDLVRRAQPRATKRLVADPAWRAPPPGVAAFTWSEQGSNLLHDLFARLPETHGKDDVVFLGPVSTTELSKRYRISRSHVQRIFDGAQAVGALGWQSQGKKRQLWLSRSFVDDHAHWQAVKFAALAEAFDWACLSIAQAA